MSSKLRPTAQDIKRGLDRPAFKNETPLPKEMVPTHDTFMVISLDKLRPFEDNPRKTRNPLYDEIKASIKARGLNNPPSITKRPNQDFYIIANGGNTRLAILNELWTETGNPSFHKIPCLFTPWQDEMTVLLGHLIENDKRGELTFIEKALGFAQMKVMYEKADATNKKTLSLKAFSERLEEGGYRISTSQLSRMFDCINSLLPALRRSLEGGLGKHKVEALLKLKSYLNRIWNKYTEADDQVFLELWLTHLYAFDLGAESIDLDNIKDAMLGELAAQLQQDYQALQMDLSLLYKNLSIDEAGHENNESASAELALDLQDTVDERQVEPSSGAIETETQTPPGKPLLSVVPPMGSAQVPLPTHSSNSSNQPVNATDNAGDERATHQTLTDTPLEASGQSPGILPAKTERLSGIEQQLAALDGQSQADTVAGRLDTPAALREQIRLLALEIAEWGRVSGVIPSDEGLGFTLAGLSHDGSSRACSAALLLTTLLRLQPSATEKTANTALTSALFGELLIGSYDIAIGTQAAQPIGLERLPDALLDSLFRLIRLARHLVDLSREEKRG